MIGPKDMSLVDKSEVQVAHYSTTSYAVCGDITLRLGRSLRHVVIQVGSRIQRQFGKTDIPDEVVVMIQIRKS